MKTKQNKKPKTSVSSTFRISFFSLTYSLWGKCSTNSKVPPCQCWVFWILQGALLARLLPKMAPREWWKLGVRALVFKPACLGWSGLVSECPLLVSTKVWLILSGVKGVMRTHCWTLGSLPFATSYEASTLCDLFVLSLGLFRFSFIKTSVCPSQVHVEPLIWQWA